MIVNFDNQPEGELQKLIPQGAKYCKKEELDHILNAYVLSPAKVLRLGDYISDKPYIPRYQLATQGQIISVSCLDNRADAKVLVSTQDGNSTLVPLEDWLGEYYAICLLDSSPEKPFQMFTVDFSERIAATPPDDNGIYSEQPDDTSFSFNGRLAVKKGFEGYLLMAGPGHISVRTDLNNWTDVSSKDGYTPARLYILHICPETDKTSLLKTGAQ